MEQGDVKGWPPAGGDRGGVSESGAPAHSPVVRDRRLHAFGRRPDPSGGGCTCAFDVQKGHGGAWRMGAAGITLVEVLVVVALVAILATLAVPGFHNLVQDGRVTSLSNELGGAVSLARSEAVRRGTAVSICPLEADSGWLMGAEGGWAVVAGTDCDNATDQDYLRIWEDLPGGVVVASNIAGDSVVTFGPLGDRISGGRDQSDRPMFLVFVQECTRDRARAMDIAPGGRIQRARTDCPDNE